jgi:hypothetical protein
MKTKKIGAIFLCMVVFSTICMVQAAAHPPGFILPRYEEDTLKVLIIHFSIAPSGSHYIYRVTIDKNGEEILVEDYVDQPRFIFVQYEYPVEAEVGDELSITAFCSLFGQKTRSITVE